MSVRCIQASNFSRDPLLGLVRGCINGLPLVAAAVWASLPAMTFAATPPVDANTVELVTSVIRDSMLAFGLRQVSVRAGEDHDGEAVLFVDADYDLIDTPIDPAVIAALTTKLRDNLWATGETRFPHIHHRFPEAQKVKARRVAAV